MIMNQKNVSVAEQTKRELAAALKEAMAQKPLDKITIFELTNACSIRRQSFYYHFEDIYDLLRWMFEKEAISLLRQQEGSLLWKEGLLQLFHYLEENRAVCLCALRSMGRDHMKRFFESDIYAIIHLTIEQLADEIGQGRHLDSFVDVETLTHFYVVALAGMMESWLLGEIDRTPEELIHFADTILNDQIRGASARLIDATSHHA